MHRVSTVKTMPQSVHNMEDIEKIYELYTKYPKLATDSRKVARGSIYLALKGERFDGNAYAKEALEKGAVAAIVDDPAIAEDDRCILVANGLDTLQNLARHHRRQFEIPIIAITGSNGKTTTKELLAGILATQYKTHFTKGNFNNHIGLPLTLLEMEKNTEVCVLEMGANHRGEIKMLCEIGEPTHGVITNIGKAHLEGFGGVEGVKKAKGELYDYLALHDKMAFVNMDEAFLGDLAAKVRKKLFYTKSDTPDRATVPCETKFIGAEPFVELAFLGESHKLIYIKSNLIGNYNFNNLMTAVSIGRYFKVPGHKVRAAIEHYVPANNRSQLIKKENQLIIMDAYNANPSSMRQALKTFAAIAGKEKVAILGDMFELGKDSAEEHQNLVNYVNTLNIDKLVLVGDQFGQCKAPNATFFSDAKSLKAENFLKKITSASHILVKGSRSMKLETIFG